MANENETQGTEAPAETAAPANEADKALEVLAREAELADIADLLVGQPQAELDDAGAKEPEKKPEEKVAGEGGKEQGTKPAAAQPPKVEEPKPEVKPGEPSTELKALLKEVIAEAKPQPEVKPAPKAEDELPRYMPKIPDNIMAAIEAEDPNVRRNGLNALIGGAMSHVYTDVMKEVKAMVATAMQQVPQVIQSTEQQREQVKKTHDEFYAANPNFASSPKLKQFIAIRGVQVAQSLGDKYKGFTPEFQALLAKDIEEMTGIKAGPVAAVEKKEPEKKKFSAGGPVTRANGAPTLGDEIADVIGLVN